jgi:hypothetical protein
MPAVHINTASAAIYSVLDMVHINAKHLAGMTCSRTLNNVKELKVRWLKKPSANIASASSGCHSEPGAPIGRSKPSKNAGLGISAESLAAAATATGPVLLASAVGAKRPGCRQALNLHSDHDLFPVPSAIPALQLRRQWTLELVELTHMWCCTLWLFSGYEWCKPDRLGVSTWRCCE